MKISPSVKDSTRPRI